MKLGILQLCVLSLGLGASLASGCYGEGRFGTFDQAEVLTFAMAGEVTPSLIMSDSHRIEVTLGEEANLEQVEVQTLTLSSLSTASIAVEDLLDLREDFVFEVRAEDGTRSDWTIVTEQRTPSTGSGGSGDFGEGGAGGEAGGDGDEPDSCPSTVATYQLTGTFQLTNTPGGLGDGVFPVGPGDLRVRYVPSGPGSGTMYILSYLMPQKFQVNAPGATTINDSSAQAGPDACGLAVGSLDGTVVNWRSCDYGPAPPLGTTSWGSSDIVGGEGCLNQYSVTGTVTCSGAFCAASGVDFPINLNELYPQPLNSFVFSEDFTTFTMKNLGAPPSNPGVPGVELPNKEPSRSWIGLDGTLVEQACEPLPNDCP